ncbi:hypothetical protein DMB65_06570 [Flavobacterium cheongpyeongense]|uniref:Uncharacterized protein n=1 Tax=Flavobacterium cheongpyeongense TaxID=2212651 RepID=A0A2V4BRM2_9FLAO|nr:hypothetical protein [Flavobacterium cheongpyeongense]PXY41611.1 hypothetical protein DMB65_06570 [Flavobacterium cheongpyeongense]
MSINHLSKETETRLIDFFTNSINPKDMAKTIRQVNYILSLQVMKDFENLPEKNSIECNFYCLNRLAEALDPYLDVE